MGPTRPSLQIVPRVLCAAALRAVAYMPLAVGGGATGHAGVSSARVGASVMPSRAASPGAALVDLVSAERARFMGGLAPLSKHFVESANHLLHELKKEMDGLLDALPVALKENLAQRELEQAAVAAYHKLRSTINQDRSRAAQVERAATVMRKEWDEAKILAAEGAAAIRKLESALEAERLQREKVEAAARTSSEVAVAHLNQLRQLRDEKSGQALICLRVLTFSSLVDF